MAEEHRCQAPPEGHRLCANNCGFFGSPATLGLCSKCYCDYRLKEDQEASAKMAVEKSLLVSASIPAPPYAAAAEAEAEAEPAAEQALSASASAAVPLLLPVKQEPCSTALAAPAAAVQLGRCTACRKRMGLTGFRCRCGDMFCGSHRHPEQHGCTFDFKSAGREAIARANPVVKANKLNKI